MTTAQKEQEVILSSKSIEVGVMFPASYTMRTSLTFFVRHVKDLRHGLWNIELVFLCNHLVYDMHSHEKRGQFSGFPEKPDTK